MITAEFFGGPRDGDVIQLRDAAPLRIPIKPDMTSFIAERADQITQINIRYLTLTPRLRADGIWVLPWHEAS